MSRVRPAAALLALLAAVLAGCSSVVDGSGTALGGGQTSGPSGSSAPSGSGASSAPVSTPPVSTPPPTSTAPTVDQGPALVPLLLKAPAGSRGWGDAWAANVTPTLAQFVAQVYTPAGQPAATAELVREELTGIAHRTWIASTGTQADVLLFSFATVSGAQHRFSFAAESKNEGTGIRHFNIKSSPLPIQTYYSTTPDSDGFIRAITYTRVGKLVMEIFSYSPGKKLRTNEILGWARAQHALLT